MFPRALQKVQRAVQVKALNVRFAGILYIAFLMDGNDFNMLQSLIPFAKCIDQCFGVIAAPWEKTLSPDLISDTASPVEPMFV